MFKLKSGLVCWYNKENIRLGADVHGYFTRNRNYLCVFSSSTAFGANQVFVKGFLLFNSLPLNTKNEVVYITFRR